MTQSSSTTSTNPTRRKRVLSGTQIMFAAILAIGLVLAVNFSSRIDDDQALRDVQQQITQEIDLLRREQSELIAELEFAQSDAFVEAWARSEGKMIREGEVLVVPVPSGIAIDLTPQNADVTTVQIGEPDPPSWSLWWSLFFDEESPSF